MRSQGLSRIKAGLRHKKHVRRISICAVILLIISLFSMYFNKRIRPVMVEMAVSEISNYALEYISLAVNEELENGLEYSDIVTLVTDENGSITALTTDMAIINTLQANLSLSILKMSDYDKEITVYIPLGTVLGFSVSSGRGWEIPLKAILVSDVEIDLISSFSTEGINQTCHRIYAEITVSYKVFIPGSWYTSEAVSRAVIAETIIVGEVPDSYYFFDESTGDEALTEYYLTN